MSDELILSILAVIGYIIILLILHFVVAFSWLMSMIVAFILVGGVSCAVYTGDW